MFEILKVIILGIVEGITEWLPISSTGHMLLLYQLFSIDETEPFWSMFLVVIQFGAILAVILMYFKMLWPFQRPAEGTKGKEKFLSAVKNDKIVMWLKILVSCIPAVVVGLTADDWIEAHLYNYIVVAIPGTSRSGATILGGILFGMSRKCASEYTFFLAIPTMFGASLLKIIKFMKGGAAMTGTQGLYIVLGMTISFAVSIFAIRFLIRYIRQHDFKVFGIYRIGLGIVVLLYFAIRSIFI